MSSEQDRTSVRFGPLQPASRGRLIAGFLLGPVLWLVAFIVAAWVSNHSSAITIGLLVTVAAFLVSLLILSVAYVLRRRRERRYAERG